MSATAKQFLTVARYEIVRTISLGRGEPLHPEPPREVHDARVELRVAKRIRRQWRREAKALGISLSEYVRAKMDGNPVHVVALADPELLAELRREANNFNQCLHGYHAGLPVDEDRLNTTIDLLAEIYHRLLKTVP